MRLSDEQVSAQRDHLMHGGLLLPIADPPPPMSDVVLSIETSGGTAEVEARVVHHMPDGAVGISFDDVESAKDRLGPVLRPGAARNEGGNLQQRIGRMSTDEKREMALTGDRIERMAMMRDTNKLMHVYVLRNPSLSSDEVRLMAGMRNLNPDALQKIAASPEWTRDQRIVVAVVSNPKTPPQVATRLLEKLPPAALRRLVKTPDVPPAIVRAARRRMLR
mgnify:CR=1 FL=1